MNKKRMEERERGYREREREREKGKENQETQAREKKGGAEIDIEDWNNKEEVRWEEVKGRRKEQMEKREH